VVVGDEQREQLRQRYLQVDTSNAADVLDDLGYHDQALSPELRVMTRSAPRLAGWAFTIRGQMMPYPACGGDPEKMRACDSVTPGSVTVWSGPASGVCCFGELIALRMRERGGVGALADGGVRDLAWLDRHGFPVYARYHTPVQSIGRWKVDAFGIGVAMPGATCDQVPIDPGDFVLADQDGVVVIPGELAEPVLDKAEQLTAAEHQLRAELENGMTLADALARFGHV
jgi:4-hydroxy-4-methyl-2-oxoglutarate aldolase